ncbi:MAG: hypothetical protein HKN58_08710 [Xanthomonadales bacterium]|nr:hypothetical protein [Xanthomonadales bacterium]
MVACLGSCAAGQDAATARLAPPQSPSSQASAKAFLAAIARHCGQSFAGEVVANHPPADSDPFEGVSLVMHVRDCSDGRLAVPFHVGADHSRTWLLTLRETGLQLKHDHRHEDGSPDAVTMYGGTSDTPGSVRRQEFPVDAESIEMFRREGLDASVVNTWAMEIVPDDYFLYELARPTGRLFQVRFDLSQPVPTPPAAWGHVE